MMNRCLFLNTFYDGFLKQEYSRHKTLASLSYKEQLTHLNDQLFGDSDFYSSGLTAAGFEAEDLIVNCRHLQSAYAREHGIDEQDLFAIIQKQIHEFDPDVLYLQDLSLFQDAHLQFLSNFGRHRKIVGQIASPIPEHAPLHLYDLVITSFPHFVDRLRAAGTQSIFQPLAFDSRVLDRIDTTSRPVDVSFVGGISSMHAKGTQSLIDIAERTTLDIWGYGADTLPEGHILKKRHHGPVFGIDLFQAFGRSKITLNRHIDVAENNANNMRLFEATGCGALLITDYKDNLNSLFEIGEEVVAYRSVEEAISLIGYYRDHPEAARRIAKAGQERTLRDHSYKARMVDTARWLHQLLDGEPLS